MIRIRCFTQRVVVEFADSQDMGIINPIQTLMFKDEVIPANCVEYCWAETPEYYPVKPENIFALNYASDAGRFVQVGGAIKFKPWSQE